MEFRLILPILALIVFPACASDASPAKAPPGIKAEAAPAPQWFLNDIEFLTRDGGRWIASNAEYQSENEPFQSYGLEWKAGYANSMTGRLFGIRDGEETGDFWRFRQYWHGGTARAVVEQFGLGGAFGIGTLWPEDGAVKMDQAFYGPDGGVTQTGHIARQPDDDTHITESYDIIDGEWRASRAYSWKRAAPISGE